jgi:alpha-mannosidase
VLLCQFHDVLPGSAIGLVYEDAERIYANVERKGLALLEEAFLALLPGSAPVKAASNTQIIAIDTLDRPRISVVGSGSDSVIVDSASSAVAASSEAVAMGACAHQTLRRGR